MSDSDRLFQKADALLGRYRGDIRPTPQPDYPILTEVVEKLADSPSEPAKRALQTAYSETDLQTLEASVMERVIRTLPALLAEISTQPQQAARIRELLDHALRDLAEASRSTLQARVAALVSEAVQAAITELRESKEADRF